MANMIYNSDDLKNSKLTEEADTSILTKASVGRPEEVGTSENYTSTEMEDGSLEIEFLDSSDAFKLDGIEAFNDIDDNVNLAELLDEDTLEELGFDVVDRLEEDKKSRAAWDDIIQNGLRMLGLTDTSDEAIFDGSATVYHPLIIEQAVDFQSKAITELFPGKGPVKTQILGESTEELEKKASRVRNHMNYQVQHQMKEYFDEKEKMLFYLPNVGSAITKGYYDVRKKRPVIEFVPIEDFFINYYAKSLEDAYSYTHVYNLNTNDMLRNQINGLYRQDLKIKELLTGDVETTELDEFNDEIFGQEKPDTTTSFDGSDMHTVYEQHVFLDLPEPYAHPDGLELPYIVHVHSTSGKVLAIFKNWETGDDNYNKIEWFVHHKYVPGNGFYGLGNIHLLGGLTKSMTLSLRSLLDAGMFANTSAGFKDKKARIANAQEPHSPGVFKDVEGPITDLSKAFYPLQFKEPSQTLFQLYNQMEQTSKRFADKSDQIISEASNTGPVGTTIALLEASMKFFSAIHKRLHNAQKNEFSLIAKINKIYLEAGENELLVPNSTLKISQDDYDERIDILPISDPNMPSNSHRVAMAQTVLQSAQQAPHLHDMKNVYRDFYSAIGIQETEEILPYDEDPEMLSPFEDIEKVMDGKPIKAFEGQDHQAHIGSKMAWLQSPQGGASPLFATIVPVLQANIREHMFIDFVSKVEGQVENPEDEAQKAMVAQDVSKFQQQQAEMQKQGGADPAKQMLAQAEVMNAESRKQEVQHKVQKENAELGLDVQEMAIKEGETAAKIAQTDAKLNMEKIKLGSDLVAKSVHQKPAK